MAVVLGDLELSVRLASSATANVFLARDPSFELIEVKILKPKAATENVYVAHLASEARAGRTLDHPHIAKVNAFVQVRGVFALVRAHADGIGLAEMPLPPEVARHVARGIAMAVEHAKSKGCTAELEPADIWLTRSGLVRVSGFVAGKFPAKLPELGAEPAERFDPEVVASFVAKARFRARPEASEADLPVFPHGETHPDPLGLFPALYKGLADDLV